MSFFPGRDGGSYSVDSRMNLEDPLFYRSHRAGVGQQSSVLPDGRFRSLFDGNQKDGSINGELSTRHRAQNQGDEGSLRR